MTGENSRFGFLSVPVDRSPLTQTTHLVYIYINNIFYCAEYFASPNNTQSLRVIVLAQLIGQHSHIFASLPARPPGDEAS